MNTRSFWPAALLLGVGLVAGAETSGRPIERARAGNWILESRQRLVSSVNTSTSGVNSATSSVNSSTTFTATWVDRVDGRKVHLKQQEISADRKTGLAPATLSVVNLDQKPAEETMENKATLVSDDKVKVGDKTIRCAKTEIVTIDPVLGKLTVITWTSDDVPLFGLVKSVKLLGRNDRELERTELLDFGDSGGTDLPVAGNSELPVAGKP